MKKASDYKLGQIVYATWFGDVIRMKVIGFSESTGQIQCQHLGAPGSFYQTPAQENEARNLYNSIMKRDFREHDLDTDANGNCYSDADPGL